MNDYMEHAAKIEALRQEVKKFALLEAARQYTEENGQNNAALALNTQDELLPCPLCGAEARIEIIAGQDNQPVAQVYCTNCPLWFGKITPAGEYEKNLAGSVE